MIKRMTVTAWATVWYFGAELILGAMMIASLYLTYQLGYLHGTYGY